ncbi:unnamed protein product [Amoebophrya sp. A25]|nr:unnamed protein product [Amoebophrya sp. A25]|eukprot:GSA25T00011337001.1
MTLTRVGLRDVTNAPPAQHIGVAKNGRKSVQKAQQAGGIAKPLSQTSQPGKFEDHGATSSSISVVDASRPTTAPGTIPQPSADDPQNATEYAKVIYEYLRKREEDPTLRVPNASFLDDQAEISSRMRGILLDWLVEVHYKFKLSPETLYLCINLIDRFLHIDRKMPRKKLQLVGGTCMLVASKYEEFRPPEVGDICYIMDNAYSRDEILEMEVRILNTLKFEVTVPSALQFLEYYVKEAGISRADAHFFLCQYLVETTLLSPKFLKYKPSELAASSLYLANRIRKEYIPWPQKLYEITKLKEQDFVKPLAKEIFEMIPGFKGKSLFKKYSMEKYGSVAPTIPSQ